MALQAGPALELVLERQAGAEWVQTVVQVSLAQVELPDFLPEAALAQAWLGVELLWARVGPVEAGVCRGFSH